MEVTKDSEDDSSSVTVLTPAETETEIKEEKNGKENTKNSQEKSDKKGNEGSDSEEKGEKVMVGLVADSVDLYAKYDKNGNRTWSDIAPDDLEEAAEGEKTEKYCVIIRKSESPYLSKYYQYVGSNILQRNPRRQIPSSPWSSTVSSSSPPISSVSSARFSMATQASSLMSLD